MLRKYFQDYESEEDEDYNPTKQEEALYRQEHEKRKIARTAELSIQELYNEMKQEYAHSAKKIKPNEEITPLELASKILNS